MTMQADAIGAPVILPLTRNRFLFPEIADAQKHFSGRQGPKAIWPEPNSIETVRAAAEAAENIRWRLPAKGSAVIAVTSPVDCEETTNLLIALAPQLAKRIAGGLLIVDADLAFRALSRRLTLAGNSTTAQSPLIFPTNFAGLHVMPAATSQGGCVPTAAWIADWRDGWPLVLLAASSLEHAETASLLRLCDGVYLVAGVGRTSRRAVTNAAKVIRAAGSRLLGGFAVAY